MAIFRRCDFCKREFLAGDKNIGKIEIYARTDHSYESDICWDCREKAIKALAKLDKGI